METEIQNLQQKKAIVLALAKVQGAIKNPKKETDNPFFKSKYADLASIWDSVRGLLSANDLAFVQLPTTDGPRVSVQGILLHSSGESIESTISGSAKDAMPQSIGSCITYLRRYQISAMLGIAAEDEDGNEASQPEKPKTLAQQKGPFSVGKPFAQHQAEQDAASALPDVPQGQQDKAPFIDKVKAGSIDKTGTNGNGQPWTLYRIEFENHPSETTFSKTIYEQAKLAREKNSEIQAHFEPGKKGPQICEIEILTPAINGKAK